MSVLTIDDRQECLSYIKQRGARFRLGSLFRKETIEPLSRTALVFAHCRCDEIDPSQTRTEEVQFQARELV